MDNKKFDKLKTKFINTNKIILSKRRTVGFTNCYGVRYWLRIIKYHNLIRIETSNGEDLFLDYKNELDTAIKKALELYKIEG